LFKKGEAFEKEALKLQGDVIHSRITPVISEWALLEVVRGLKKASYRRARWMIYSVKGACRAWPHGCSPCL
jgi:hypothetical protein